MKNKLLILFCFFSFSGFSHKFYVAIADMKYNTEKNRIEGTLKVTAHDFEAILEDRFDRKIDIEKVADTSTVGVYIQSYLATNVTITSGGKKATPNYLGKEVTMRGELFFYFTFTEIVNPKSIEIMNTVLFGKFAAQQNIVHYQYKDQRKSVTLVAAKRREKIIFD